MDKIEEDARKLLWYQNIQEPNGYIYNNKEVVEMPVTFLTSIDDVSEADEGKVIYNFADGSKCYSEFVLNVEDVDYGDIDNWLKKYKMVGIEEPAFRYFAEIHHPQVISSTPLKAVKHNDDNTYTELEEEFYGAGPDIKCVHRRIVAPGPRIEIKPLVRRTVNREEYIEMRKMYYQSTKDKETNVRTNV